MRDGRRLRTIILLKAAAPWQAAWDFRLGRRLGLSRIPKGTLEGNPISYWALKV